MVKSKTENQPITNARISKVLYYGKDDLLLSPICTYTSVSCRRRKGPRTTPTPPGRTQRKTRVDSVYGRETPRLGRRRDVRTGNQGAGKGQTSTTSVLNPLRTYTNGLVI